MSNLSFPVEWLPSYTFTDYQKWEGDWELIRGVPFAMSPGPFRRHQLVGGRFVYEMIDALKRKGNTCSCEVLYETDWIIDEATVVKPDVMVVCDAPPSDFVRVPPVLVLEIFSPSTRLKDRNIKFNMYEQNGVKYYLMADPEKNSVEIFKLTNNRFEEMHDTTFKLSEACTIELNLSEIWA